MYYILNETNQIIAADTDLLELCGLTHIDELNLNIALGKIKLDLTSEEDVTITERDNDTTYPVAKTFLSSLLGHLTLVDIKGSEKKSEDALSTVKIEELEEGLSEDIEESILSSDMDTELFSIEPDADELSIVTEPEEDYKALVDLDLNLEEPAESIEEAPLSLTEDTDTLDLDFLIKEEEAPEAEPAIDESAEIFIDIEKVSQRIGVSQEDYDTFLNEYIDTALALENDLRSPDTQERSNAIGTLSHLSDLLQLPMMSDMIAKIDTAAEEQRKEVIASFYSALSRITTSQTLANEPELELFGIEEELQEAPESAVEENENSFGSISLEGIKPIYFDFRLEEAAHDLSLPIDLIEEFVHDFIEQAHIETEKMLKAYEEGDLDTIQKIGHLLKGASSNLRINALSDTLYKIQFCEDVSKLEEYIKDYWAHFLSFEIQINALAK